MAVPSLEPSPSSKEQREDMDIQRPASVAQQKRRKRILIGVIAALAVAGVSYALSRLEPAAPTVERATVWVDTVKRGQLIRQVRGLGTLVPVDEARRWLPSATQGRVERIILRPGAQVTPDTVILELADPQLQQQLLEAENQMRAAEADLVSLRARLETERLNQRSIAATVDADYEQAQLEREVNEGLSKDGLVSTLILKQSTVRAESLRTRSNLEKERLSVAEENVRAQLLAQQARVDQLRTLFTLRRQQVDQLRVRAGMTGVLEQVPVEVGQQVAPGTNVARVADPNRLKAELRIAETQARDLTIGQVAQVDTRNGIIPGKVVRIDPAAQNGTVTVDVELQGELPRGARPDLSVDGTVELDRLDNVLFVGRPAFGQENSAVGLFLLNAATGEASRTQVQLGRSSVNTIEVKGGVKEGDQLVLSDMSAWDAFDRVRLR
jgi:HlyD family secretion protein